MLDNLNKYNIILGSNSPRRKELLKGLNLSFTVKTIDGINESYPPSIPIQDIPLYIAKKKAAAYLPLLDNELLITADTIVRINDSILGKPADRSDAIRMLKMLAGNTHEVLTGVCIITNKQERTFSVSSNVKFAQLSANDIEFYVDNYKPFDKAGAYGIQEWIGFVAVEAIEGSFYNVMGLPVQKVYRELSRF
ncbi:MAG: Maf-like protein [Tannerellaceae bacterium]|jgi:septum formation protein|nr:Maf-like protein [Tannerellaceae bacterium]